MTCVQTFQQEARQLGGGIKPPTVVRGGSSPVMEREGRREGREGRGGNWWEEEAVARPRGLEKGPRRQEVSLG